MAWLTAWLTKGLLRTLAPYLAGAALCGLVWASWAAYVASWEAAVADAEEDGKSKQEATQTASDAVEYRNTIERVNDATADPLSDCDAIRVLRDIAGPHAPAEPEGEDCGPL